MKSPATLIDALPLPNAVAATSETPHQVGALKIVGAKVFGGRGGGILATGRFLAATSGAFCSVVKPTLQLDLSAPVTVYDRTSDSSLRRTSGLVNPMERSQELFLSQI